MDKWPANDPLTLRLLWLLVGLVLLKGHRPGAGEAMRNVIRRKVPVTWKTGEALYMVEY